MHVRMCVCMYIYIYVYIHIKYVKVGSNMTGTDVARFSHKQSRSYLNHLVHIIYEYMCVYIMYVLCIYGCMYLCMQFMYVCVYVLCLCVRMNEMYVCMHICTTSAVLLKSVGFFSQIFCVISLLNCTL